MRSSSYNTKTWVFLIRNSVFLVSFFFSLFKGTHDVQRATASSSADMPGMVTMQATFAVNSPALGFLVILVDPRGTAVSFSSALRPNHTVVLSGLTTADSYTAVVFDVESTGLPSTRAAAVDVVIVTSTEPIAC